MNGTHRSRLNPLTTATLLAGVVGLLSFSVVLRQPASASIEEYTLRIDPNRATEADLTALPGIGAGRAAAIISFRDELRREAGLSDDDCVFSHVEQLLGVRGIGGKTLDRMEPFLEISCSDGPRE